MNFSQMSPTSPTTGGGVPSIMGWGTSSAPAPTTGAGAPGTTPPLDNSGNNYLGSGMTQDQWYQAHGYGTPDQMAGAASAAGAAATTAGNNAANNPTINPTLGLPSLTAGATSPTYGTQSGPGILQQWFDERANGTDPGYEYETGRGLTALGNEQAARGGFNSGAAEQQDSDYLANMGAQREGQLDALAGGSSNENLSQINQMLGLGMGLGSGEAGTAGQYDTGAATDWMNSNNTGLSLAGQAAMIPYLARQQLMQNMMGLGGGILGSVLGG